MYVFTLRLFVMLIGIAQPRPEGIAGRMSLSGWRFGWVFKRVLLIVYHAQAFVSSVTRLPAFTSNNDSKFTDTCFSNFSSSILAIVSI